MAPKRRLFSRENITTGAILATAVFTGIPALIIAHQYVRGWWNNPMREIIAEGQKIRGSEVGDCRRRLFVYNNSGDYLDNIHMGWSLLPPKTMIFDWMDGKEGFLWEKSEYEKTYTLPPDSSVSLDIELPSCIQENAKPWVTFRGNKVPVDRWISKIE